MRTVGETLKPGADRPILACMRWLRRILSRSRGTLPKSPRARVVPTQAPGRGLDDLLGAVSRPPVLPPEIGEDEIQRAAGAVIEHSAKNNPGPASFPGIATRIVDLLAASEPDFNRLVQVVGQDIAIAAKLIQVANSPLYTGGDVVDVRTAVLKLGLKEVGKIALGLAGRSLFKAESRAEFGLFPVVWDQIFHDAMTKAFAASWLSLFARVGRSDGAFLAGMLQDIGKPIAARALAHLVMNGAVDDKILRGGVGVVIERAHVEIGKAVTVA